MKVVIVSDYFLRPYGGLQTHVYHLAKNIAKQKVETHILTISDIDDDLYVDGFYIHFIKRSFNIPRLFTIPFDDRVLEKKIFEIDPDVVHIHSTHYPYNMVTARIQNRYPTILTIHGLMKIEYKFNRGLNFFAGIVSVFLEKFILSKVKNVIVCSPIIKDLIEDMVPSDSEINIIPNGIEYDEIEQLGNKMGFISSKGFSILYIGLLENIKGVDLLLKAIPLIKDAVPKFTVYIAGKGSQEAYLKKLIKKLKIEDKVKFVGYINNINKYSYFKSADLCVVPSRYESFGIVILEAMASGTPIVASSVGNIPELIKNDGVGLKFKEGDIADFANKIIKLLNNKDLRDKISLNAKVLAQSYKWEKIAFETIQLYLKLKDNVNLTNKIKKLSEMDHWDSLYDIEGYPNQKSFESYADHLFWNYCKQFLPKNDNAKILEIGSAPGFRLLEFNQKMNYEPYGVEYSNKGCELNKKLFTEFNCNPDNIICTDFFSKRLHIDYKNFFDIVVSFGFIEHFVNVDQIIIKHINLLKKNGILMISIPNFKGINLTLSKFFTPKKVLDIHNFEIMEIERFKKLFENKGLETCFCDYYGTFDFSLIYYVRQNSWKDLPYLTLFMISIVLNYIFIFMLREKNPENRNISPFILYIGKKKH